MILTTHFQFKMTTYFQRKLDTSFWFKNYIFLCVLVNKLLLKFLLKSVDSNVIKFMVLRGSFFFASIMPEAPNDAIDE